MNWLQDHQQRISVRAGSDPPVIGIRGQLVTGRCWGNAVEHVPTPASTVDDKGRDRPHRAGSTPLRPGLAPYRGWLIWQPSRSVHRILRGPEKINNLPIDPLSG